MYTSAAILLSLFAFARPAMAQQQCIEKLYTWDDGTVAGWDNDPLLTTLTNAGGYLNVQFKSQSMPASVSDIAKVPMHPGVVPTNIVFRFLAADSLPSAAAVYLHSAVSGNSWYVTLQGIVAGEWIEYSVPVDSAGRWVMGPESPESQFLEDITSVDYVGIYVRRAGSTSVQNYGIDDFMISGVKLPESVSISGTVTYGGQQGGLVFITVESVAGVTTSATISVMAPGPYEITGLPPFADYSVSAYRDSSSNYVYDAWEAFGSWPGNPLRIRGESAAGVNITLSDPRSLEGLPYWWVRQYFGFTSFGLEAANSLGDLDSDKDGVDNYSEYRAGTNPDDVGSQFIAEVADTNDFALGKGVVIEWSSVPGRTYSVMRATNLSEGFVIQQSGITATPPMNSYRDSTATGDGPYFYRLKIEK